MLNTSVLVVDRVICGEHVNIGEWSYGRTCWDSIFVCLGEVDKRIAFGQLTRFAWRELQLAADNFNEQNVLGKGGFGKVYKGVLSNNTEVAVKRLNDYESSGGDAAFQREVEMISVAIHRNLLRFIGFCSTPTECLWCIPSCRTPFDLF
ncbi:putative LRR receptor-like serine/threonine-protein kinase [Camellia lanceoleosa]|uniref:LRR receptor-like serine/threonine-protein kinase n=1 Tax=Camellia lanceoleosa TaxID=1840588 RepID=A0ACC0IUU7_9ERIC|nr:putative LRR receptor-like serine/threonine-protein kinase [Camellia lanceoleosa]